MTQTSTTTTGTDSDRRERIIAALTRAGDEGCTRSMLARAARVTAGEIDRTLFTLTLAKDIAEVRYPTVRPRRAWTRWYAVRDDDA